MMKTSCLSPVPQTRIENLSERRQATARHAVEKIRAYFRAADITADAWYGSPPPRCSDMNLVVAVGRDKSEMVIKMVKEKVRAEIEPISFFGRIRARIIRNTRFIENCTAF